MPKRKFKSATKSSTTENMMKALEKDLADMRKTLEAQGQQYNESLAASYLQQQTKCVAREPNEEKVLVGRLPNNRIVQKIGGKVYDAAGEQLGSVCNIKKDTRATMLANEWLTLQEVAPTGTPTLISTVLELVCSRPDIVSSLDGMLELCRMCRVSHDGVYVQTSEFEVGPRWLEVKPGAVDVIRMHDEFGVSPFHSYNEFFNIAFKWAFVFRNSMKVSANDLYFVHKIARGCLLDDTDLQRLASCAVAPAPPFVYSSSYKDPFSARLLEKRIEESGPVVVSDLEAEFDVAGMSALDRKRFYRDLMYSNTRLDGETVRACTIEDREKPRPCFRTFELQRCLGPRRFHDYIQFARWEGIQVITEADIMEWDRD